MKKLSWIIMLFVLLASINLFSQTDKLISDWQKFYQSLGMKVDFSNLPIPPKQEGFDRLIVVAKGMTPQKANELCQKEFKFRKLREKIGYEDRTADKKSYAIWVRNRVESDNELKELSANDLTDKNILGITVTERLLLELKYFKETGKHLDIKSKTLCTGSRYVDGGVPITGFGSGSGSRIIGCSPGFGGDFIRARQVVSF